MLHPRHGGKRFDKRKAETAKRKISEWWSKWWDDSCFSFLRNSSNKNTRAGFLQVVSGVKMLQPEKLTWNQQLKIMLVWFDDSYRFFFGGFQLFMFFFLDRFIHILFPLLIINRCSIPMRSCFAYGVQLSEFHPPKIRSLLSKAVVRCATWVLCLRPVRIVHVLSIWRGTVLACIEL